MTDMTTPADTLKGMRVDLVGSFLRPERLVQAVLEHARGALSAAALRTIQDEAVRSLIAEEEAHGLPIATDGEYRRGHWMESIAGVTGLELWLDGIRESVAGTTSQIQEDDEALKRGGAHLYRTPRVPIPRRVTLEHNHPLEDWRAAQALTATPVKGSLLGAQYLIQGFQPEGSEEAYPTIEGFTRDLVSVQRSIVSQLVEAGCRYVHIDGPGYTSYADENNLSAIRARGDDPDEEMRRAMAADSAIVEDFPDVTFGIHLCRGNRLRYWHREGTYDAIAERLFNGLAHDRFMLEYDSERAGDFSALRFLPPGKTAVLGLITTKYGDVEAVDDLKRRLEEASRYVAIEQLAISPQCGFASMLEGNLLSEDEQWRKIDVMLETAQEVWS